MNKGWINEQKFSVRFGLALNEASSCPFNYGSDTINGISLKSNRFSIPSLLKYSETSMTSVDELVNNHIENTASRCYCITIREKYYFMGKQVFAQAMKKFGYLTNDSSKKKLVKVKCNASLKLRDWLELQGIKGIE